VLHPDQYVVLSSDSPQVSKVVKILERHARTFDFIAAIALGINEHSWRQSQRATIRVITELPEGIRTA